MMRDEDCSPVSIILADGRVKVAKRSGTACLTVHGKEKPTRLMLNDMLVVPGLCAPLLCIRQAAGRGCKVEFDLCGETIKNEWGKIQFRGLTAGKIYNLLTLSSGGAAYAASGAITALTWHRHFGHLRATSLERTEGAVSGMDLRKEDLAELRQTTCVPCIEGKMTRAPFQAGKETTSSCLEIIYSDTCRPMPQPSRAGNMYFTTIIEKHMRWKALVPHKVRREAKDAVMSVINHWETQTATRAKVILTDGALDFKRQLWDNWTRGKENIHITTACYTPEQNGLAKRYNRTVMERMLSMLSEARLDNSWRVEAAETANYVTNRVPNVAARRLRVRLSTGRSRTSIICMCLAARRGSTRRSTYAESCSRAPGRVSFLDMGRTSWVSVCELAGRWSSVETFTTTSRLTPPPRPQRMGQPPVTKTNRGGTQRVATAERARSYPRCRTRLQPKNTTRVRQLASRMRWRPQSAWFASPRGRRRQKP